MINKQNKFIYIVLTMFTLVSCNNDKYIEKDFSIKFNNIDSAGSILIYDMNNDIYTVYNKEQSEARLSPASTFKIYNALFALESGVASNIDHKIEWNRRVHYYKPWNKTHTLESAIEDSVVWYFEEIARKIGLTRMEIYLKSINYGNNNLSPQIDKFWLNGGLEISPKEQILLLRKLYNLQLPFSDNSQQLVKQMITLEEKPNYTISGKTGLLIKGNYYYGWFVGYVETETNVYIFATLIQKNKSEFTWELNEAKVLTKDILIELNIVEVE